jgi:hypothetical protein
MLVFENLYAGHREFARIESYVNMLINEFNRPTEATYHSPTTGTGVPLSGLIYLRSGLVFSTCGGI